MKKLNLKCISASLLITAVFTIAWISETPVKSADAKAFLGRWDINVLAAPGSEFINRARFCWLELKEEDGSLKGRVQPGEGAALDITDIKIENGELSFSQGKSMWKGTVKGKNLEGTVTSTIFGKETRNWIGVRGPVWPAKLPVTKPGKPVDLIGKDVSGWLLQKPDVPIGWSVKDGILLNESNAANNIYTKQKFMNFKLDAEFKVDPKSNSGIYLRGRDEIQVMDGYGATLNVHSMGALYGFIAPPVNACKPSSEWQTYEITLIANRVTVILNGIKLIDNGEVPGITGGVLNADEGKPGPLMIQGDHGRVQWRKLTITPLI